MAKSKVLRKINTYSLIGDEVFPISNWTVTLANQGSMGTASLKGSYSDLLASGLDLIDAIRDPDGASVEIWAGFDETEELVFSGVADGTSIDVDDDTFEVKCRDNASFLADGKQTLADINTRNQSVADIVRQIADKFNFETEITDPGTKAGPLMNGEHFFNPQPRSYWNLLQELAENVNYECYVTPDQVLYFGPEKEQGDIECNYGAEPNSGVKNPAWGMAFDFNPRENSNVEVRAISYNPQTTEPVTHQTTAEEIMFGLNKKKKRKGRKKKGPILVKSKGGKKKHGKAVQYIRCPGLTPDQAKARCQGVADALAKRQVIISFHTELNTKFRIHTQVTLKESTIDLYGFADIPLNVCEVTHKFDEGEGESGGLVTEIRAIAQLEGA